jgi:hypothetical protein
MVQLHHIKFPETVKNQKEIWAIYHKIKTHHKGKLIPEIIKIIRDTYFPVDEIIVKKNTYVKSLFMETEIKPKVKLEVDYKNYMSSPKWLGVSKQLRDNRGRCELCDSKKLLNVHHINYKILGEEGDLNNQKNWLMVVCSNCHFLIHSNILLSSIDPLRCSNLITRVDFLKDYNKFLKEVLKIFT